MLVNGVLDFLNNSNTNMIIKKIRFRNKNLYSNSSEDARANDRKTTEAIVMPKIFAGELFSDLIRE